MNSAANPLARFDGVERVVADPLRFKLKLNIGEDAYGSLRLKKHLGDAWDVGGVAATGAGLAASPVVATSLFASTASGGVLSWVGLGAAAATPVGWIVAAALASGGAYYGVTRAARKFAGSRVETIPKFINTPLDLLGATLFDLIGALAARVAMIDGQIDASEKSTIAEHFVREWGLDETYVGPALELILAEAGESRVKALARTLAQFQSENPDCNAAAMQSGLMSFLRDVAEADGVLDEREELALDAIAAVFKQENELTLEKARRGAGKLVNAAAETIGSVIRRKPPAGQESP